MKSKLTVYDNGNKSWELPNGKFHREDGPAVEYSNGSKQWWLNGLRHRENGPAVELSSGKEWWLNGKNYTEQEYKNKMRSRKLTKLLK